MNQHNYFGFDNWADVIYREAGKWYHVNGGHCSCYGLEDQWEPEDLDPAVHLAALKDGKRFLNVYDSENDYPEATPENFDKWLAWAVQQ